MRTLNRVDATGESVQSVENAFLLLRELAYGNSDRTAMSLARATGISKPAVYRLLRAMQRSNAVVQDGPRGCYSIGIGLRELAAGDRWQEHLRRVALPEMYRLRSLTGESVVLYGLSGPFEATCVETVASTNSIRHVERIGERFALTRGATSMILLADRARHEGHAVVEAWLRSCEPEDIRGDIASVMRRVAHSWDGTASTGQRIPGCCAVAAPIRPHGNKPVSGVLAVSGPQERFSAQQVRHWTNAVREATRRVAVKLAVP
jgi:IclR family KDG regulon transcriptional repressor